MDRFPVDPEFYNPILPGTDLFLTQVRTSVTTEELIPLDILPEYLLTDLPKYWYEPGFFGPWVQDAPYPGIGDPVTAFAWPIPLFCEPWFGLGMGWDPGMWPFTVVTGFCRALDYDTMQPLGTIITPLNCLDETGLTWMELGNWFFAFEAW